MLAKQRRCGFLATAKYVNVLLFLLRKREKTGVTERGREREHSSHPPTQRIKRIKLSKYCEP